MAMISFFAYWHLDQATDAAARPHNWLGLAGNAIANRLVNYGFGIAAIFIPAMMLWTAAHGLGLRRLPMLKPMIGMAATMILLSLTLGIISGNSAYLGSGLGGAHGYTIGYRTLLPALGFVGTTIILLLAYLALSIYLFPTTMLNAARHILCLVKQKTYTTSEAFSSCGERPSHRAVRDPLTARCETLSSSGENVSHQAENASSPTGSKKKGTSDITFEVEASEDEDIAATSPAPKTDASKATTTNAPIVIDPNSPLPMPAEGIGDIDEAEQILPSQEPFDPKKDLEYYEYPSPELLNDYQRGERHVTNDELENNKNRIVTALGHFGISIKHIKATIGPTVTLYEIVPADGVRISKIKGLENDIALSLAALGIRIIAPMPGKGTIGIEVPNQHPEIVPMQAIVRSQEFQDAQYELPLALGKTITNRAYVIDLAKMPHLLIAGATGQGKSVGLNAILVSLLYKMHPAQLKLVLVDPKKVELPLYALIEKHFLAQLPDADEAIITDNKKVIYTINSLCIEMDDRYLLLKEAGVRNIKEYNQKFIDRRLNPRKGHRYLPYIVLVIDEFADLIMTAGKEIETPIARLAQLARAIGIHLIIATQRPTVNIITGLIKANFPARIAFRVTSLQDSRTILDQSGAQQLIGKGDMLVSTGSDLVRVQCAFVDTPEVERITAFIGAQQGYGSTFELPEYTPPDSEDSHSGRDSTDYNSMSDDDLMKIVAVRLFEVNNFSTSFIQRKFKVGYNKAGRLMDKMEELGIVGPQQGSKPRQALVGEQTLRELLEKI
jgi:S-DNA-T family DNA segregation ATPase FtsK/SpoIIIE